MSSRATGRPSEASRRTLSYQAISVLGDSDRPTIRPSA